jgi:mRNA-degrading endonuclease RelE of RelBE toxin-antitoxin system
MRQVVLSPAAVRAFKKLPAAARSLVRTAMLIQLEREDATAETRNRFRLRRPSPHADFELRVERWRLFYRVQGNVVIVELVGRKEVNRLIIEGKEFVL